MKYLNARFRIKNIPSDNVLMGEHRLNIKVDDVVTLLPNTTVTEREVDELIETGVLVPEIIN